MKRPILTLLASAALFTALTAAGSPAQARDLSGRWGLGVSTVYGARGFAGPGAGAPETPLGLGLPGVSARYGINDRLNLNFGLGIAYRSMAAKGDVAGLTTSEYTAGARLLYNVVQEGNANFYLGGGLILNMRGASDSSSMASQGKQIRIPAVFGVDLFFSKSGSFSVHAEGGLEIGYWMPNGDNATVLTANTVGGVFNVGFHWFFAGPGGDAGDGG